MKKFVFTALAAVLMMSSGMALAGTTEFSTSIVIEDGGICRYSITRTYIDASGNKQQETKHYSAFVEDKAECESRAGTHVSLLNAGLTPW